MYVLALAGLNLFYHIWRLVSLFFPFLQLVLEAHNVPELSAGVNCTFENLAEMNGLVEGNRIKCSSPAEKEMPRIIVDKGKKKKKRRRRLESSRIRLGLDWLSGTCTSGYSPFCQKHACPRAMSVLWIFVFSLPSVTQQALKHCLRICLVIEWTLVICLNVGFFFSPTLTWIRSRGSYGTLVNLGVKSRKSHFTAWFYYSISANV